MSRTVALMLAFVTAGVLAAGSSGAANARRTVGLGQPLTITKANLDQYTG